MRSFSKGFAIDLKLARYMGLERRGAGWETNAWLYHWVAPLRFNTTSWSPNSTCLNSTDLYCCLTLLSGADMIWDYNEGLKTGMFLSLIHDSCMIFFWELKKYASCIYGCCLEQGEGLRELQWGFTGWDVLFTGSWLLHDIFWEEIWKFWNTEYGISFGS